MPPTRHPDNGLADYILAAKYARFRRDLGRRESFAEVVGRAEAMHLRHFRNRLGERLGEPDAASPELPGDRRLLHDQLAGLTLAAAIHRAFAAVAARRVLPSMRSLQFGGDAILRNQARLFNCSFSPIDRLEFFREYLFLLLAGTGCGFSVQRHHVERLPALPPRGAARERPRRALAVPDTTEGWADALHFLVRSHWEGFQAEFRFAPAQLPLRQALTAAAAILDGAAGRRLRPIEAYDLCMVIAGAVLGGGSRRSATICLFSPDDAEMAAAKTGDWLERHPTRTASNNSAVVPRTGGDQAGFRRLIAAQEEFGEPGFYFSDHPEYGCNPCGEVGLHPVVDAERAGADEVARLRAAGYAGPLGPAQRLSGWQMCNLSTINGAAARTPDDFLVACVHAAVIGTLQAAYTDIPYLGPITRYLNERDALLGVSICGFMDRPDLLLDPALLARGARLVRGANILVAAALGLPPAARSTCVKPEGTTSLLLGTAAGIHPHHARRYFRRVQADRNSPVYRRFRAANPHLAEPSVYRPATDDVLTFAVEAPRGALVRDDLGAVDFLRLVERVQRAWVLNGEAPDPRSPGLHHNVSHTCTVRSGEWEAVADFIWRHRDLLAGVSLLPYEGDRRYPQAPREAVVGAEAEARWHRLVYQPVDYADVADVTNPATPPAQSPCEGGACAGD